MRRFFTEPQNINGDEITIFEDMRHIQKVLRMNCGDQILVFDGSGWEYIATLTKMEKSICRAQVVEKRLSLSEPKTHITLFQGLPKSDKMEQIIQKAVELGVSEVVPVIMERCVSRINDKKAGEEKALRWNKISVEAAKQCGRGKIPKVSAPIAFKDAVSALKDMELSVMPYEELGHEGELGLKALLDKNNEALKIGIIVGPEGGFSEEEATFAIENGINAVGLGKRILRTETVASALIPVIMFYKGEF